VNSPKCAVISELNILMYVCLLLQSVNLSHYCACDLIEKNEVDGVCSACGEERDMYKVLVGKPE
jgi:hypothetical protein